MSDAYSLSRNTTEGFAQRVRKNLDFIVKKRNEGEDVHEVTQLVTSLLGIIILIRYGAAYGEYMDRVGFWFPKSARNNVIA